MAMLISKSLIAKFHDVVDLSIPLQKCLQQRQVFRSICSAVVVQLAEKNADEKWFGIVREQIRSCIKALEISEWGLYPFWHLNSNRLHSHRLQFSQRVHFWFSELLYLGDGKQMFRWLEGPWAIGAVSITQLRNLLFVELTPMLLLSLARFVEAGI